MDLLTRSLATEADEAPESFFPRHGDWTWYPTWAGATGVHRFRAAETKRALDDFCPLRDSFTFQPEGQPMGGLIGWSLQHRKAWRRVRGTRFVPPREPASSPVFVEWKREDGRWVISSFGDASGYAAPMPANLPNTISRDTGATAGVGGYEWIVQHTPLHFEGRRYFLNGSPRVLSNGEITRFGTLDDVAIYREAGTPDLWVLWVVVGPGPEVIPIQTTDYPACVP